MKKLLVILLAALMMVSVFGCKGQEAETVDIIGFDDEPEASAPPAEVEVSEHGYGSGMTVAGNAFSLGVRTDGTVIATGQNTDGQCDVSTWQNIVYAAAGDNLSVGVKEDGTVVYTGAAVPGIEDLASWTNVKKVAVGDGIIVGLTNDGYVMGVGDVGDAPFWTEVADIQAAGKHVVALKTDGSVVVTGDQADPGWSGCTAISTNKTSVLAVKADGTVQTTGQQALSGWNNLKTIAAGEGITVGVKNDGTVVTDAADDVSAVANAVSCSAGNGHALIMNKDGMVTGIGSNDAYQIRTSSWILRPYNDNGFLVGFGVGDKASRVIAILNDMYNTESAELKSLDGTTTVGADDVVFTGAQAMVDGAAVGTIVIRGDVDGNGVIDDTDASTINNYILSNVEASGMNLAAAGIYVSVNGDVMTSSVDAVKAYIANPSAGIPQFRSASTGHTYDEKIATAKGTNDDVTGWVQLPGTLIDFPIMKATKDYHYNNYTWDDKKDATGSIYMYYNEARQGQFYAFTGHNNRKRAADKPGDPTAMFHDLHHIYDANMGRTTCLYEKCGASLDAAALPNLKEYSGRVWDLNILGEEGLWEVFSVYCTTEKTEKTNLDTLYDAIWFYKGDMGWSEKLDTLYTEKTKSKEEIRTWIDEQIGKSEIDLGVKVGDNDKLLTVVTCGTNSSKAGERLYYILHKVG
ncbi:MAG: hypothetical protein PHC80_06255 [Eubacteriales bacterium]|nr:hypothetical protein [Eubacteriales bacterium]